MKKVLLTLICVMIFAACSSEDEEKYTTIDENSLEFDSNGGSQTISISSNTNWYIDDNPFEWITVSSSKEGSGNAQVTISVATNPDYDKRTGFILITSDGFLEPIQINISQSQKDAILIPEQNSTFGWKGGTKEFTYKSNVNMEIVIPETMNWVHAEKTRTLSNGKITITVDENSSLQRQGTITLKGDNISKDFSITQEGFIPMQSVSLQEGTNLFFDRNANLALHPVFIPANSSDQTLEWTSSDSDIIEVDQNGVLNIKTNGTSIISAYNNRADKTAIAYITAKIKAESIQLYNVWGGNLSASCFEGNWGYSFIPQIVVEPANAYIKDLVLISENENLVSIAGSTVICNSQGRTGQTRITANLPYSGISSSFDINVQCCYLKAGLGTIEQNENKFLINFAGQIYSNNSYEKFKIEGISITDENNQLITTANSFDSNNTDRVRWQSNQINLRDYGIYVIDNVFYETLSKWNAIVTYRYNDSENIISENVKIDATTSY